MPNSERAVDARGVQQLVRNALHELADQEDPERAGRARQDHAPVVVDQPELGHGHVVGIIVIWNGTISVASTR